MTNRELIKEVSKNPMYRYLLLLVVALTLGFQAWRTLYNNYAVDEIGINGLQTGIIQSVREIPGFLALLVVYLLIVFKEHRLAVYSVMLMGVGIITAGLIPSFTGLVVTTLLMSIGFHYFETVNQSLTLQYFKEQQAPVVIGRLKSFRALTNILVGVVIWLFSKFATISISRQFFIFGGAVVLIALVAFVMDPVDKSLPVQHKKMIVKRKYMLFYILNFLSGARRQIFVVFAIFLLVEKYRFQLNEIAILFVINNVITYFVAPLTGKWINRFGEKAVMAVEYTSLIIIFLAYAFVQNRYVVAGLYIADHIFFSASMAINTFFQKTADKEDIAPSMAVGFTINHISAVVIPVIGGALWMINPQIPFFAGAIIAVFSLFFSRKIVIQNR